MKGLYKRPKFPFSVHDLDPRAYASIRAVDRGGPGEISKDERWRLFWLGYLDDRGEVTDRARFYLRAMRSALAEWTPADRCTACRGVYHPATGHVLGEGAQLCGPCARDFLAWLKRHTSRMWGKRRFYDYAATSREKTGPEE